MKIFLCGTHSCGKTTLANEIARRFGFQVVSEAARDIIVADKVDFASFNRDMIAADSFQMKVTREHVRRYESAPKGDVVFDRGLDFLVYSSMFHTVCADMYDKYFHYVERLKEKDARVFVLDPHTDLIKADGVRASLDMETAWSITNGTVLLLEIHRIPYLRLTSPKLLERIKAVDTVIRWTKS